MNSDNSLNIIFRNKIPYFSSALSIIIGVLFAVLCILYVVMLPADKASPEMKVGYFILVVPEGLKAASGWSALGLAILWPIYISVKRNQPGVLIMEATQVKVQQNSSVRIVPLSSIKRVVANDMTHLGGRPKYKTEVIFSLVRGEQISFASRGVLASPREVKRVYL
ncbi:MAG: hypothetical protein EOP54_32990 [Sphingobacteriales bacterium]|nr:MAG: hypothetical protein EOP54_32990 [Sphingobacteriales bacterium]